MLFELTKDDTWYGSYDGYVIDGFAVSLFIQVLVLENFNILYSNSNKFREALGYLHTKKCGTVM